MPGVGPLRLIGRGGTASVFEAQLRTTGERVAVKVLHVRLDAVDERNRFVRDLERVTRVNGERSIAPVRSFGVNDSGHPWIITDFLPRSLADELRAHGSLPWAEVAAVGAQVADALAAAHRAGLLHGDLKPVDIRFDDRGMVRLADLGLSRYAGATGAPASSTDARIAHTAPELAAGRSVDARIDVYSLASVLYEAVSGQPPLGRVADHGALPLVDQLVHRAPDSLAGKGVPAELDRVLLGALAKDPSTRPRTADALADALGAASRAARSTVVTRQAGSLPAASLPTLATAPFAPEDVPFDELDTPAEGYPIIEEAEVLDATSAAPLLAAAGRRERRRRREVLLGKVLVAGAVVAGIAGVIVWLVTRGDSPSIDTTTVTSSSVPTVDTATTATDALRPVGTIGYSFVASFDTRDETAALSGVASPTGEARLKNALISVGRLDNALSIEDGPEPDEGAAVADGITLLAEMRRSLVAGILRFDGQTFSISGFYRSDSAGQRLRDVIALLRTPVARPDLNPDPTLSSDTAAPVTTSATSFTVIAESTAFSIPADGRFHVFPLTLQPSNGATSLCLVSRTVSGGSESALLMTYSSCGLARIVTISATAPGTYVVNDTFAEDRAGTDGPSANLSFTIVVT